MNAFTDGLAGYGRARSAVGVGFAGIIAVLLVAFGVWLMLRPDFPNFQSTAKDVTCTYTPPYVTRDDRGGEIRHPGAHDCSMTLVYTYNNQQYSSPYSRSKLNQAIANGQSIEIEVDPKNPSVPITPQPTKTLGTGIVIFAVLLVLGALAQLWVAQSSKGAAAIVGGLDAARDIKRLF